MLYSQELLRKNYSIWISNEYSNVYCLKSVKAIAFKIWLWVVNSYIFWSKQKKEIMSILGKDIPSQRKNRTLLKRRHRWLCLASVYEIIWNTLVKHGFIQKKKKNEHIWNRIFHWNFVTCWCIQKRYAAKLLHWTDIHIKINRNFWWNSVPHDHSNAYLPDI